MRILYLVPDLFGPPSGIARYCRMVCRALVEAGHHVSVVSLHDQPSARKSARATFPSLNYVPCSGSRARFIQHALRHVKYQPDLVLVGHAHFAHLGKLVSWLFRAPLVSFIYGIEVWEPLSPARRSALNASRVIVSISRFSAQRASEVNGVPKHKVSIVHNCLDPHFRALPPSEVLPVQAPRNPSILTVARISLNEQYKGHDVVIRALPALLAQFPDLIYHVVGAGDGLALLKTLTQEQGVADAVHFHGAVSEVELIAAYNDASVFVMPSRFEGFGFVFLEAMAYGKPVVAGNQDASPEVVANGRVGLTIDPTSVEAVADAVARLLSDPLLCDEMGRAATHHVSENFSFDSFKEQLLAVLPSR